MSKRFSITQIPQADELSKVILTAEAIYNDCRTDTQIADYVGFTDRQGRYYRLAGELLGLISNLNNNAELTQLGIDLVILDNDNRIKKIRKYLFRNDFFSYIINHIESLSSEIKLGVTRDELSLFMLESIEGAESTICRRVNTVVNWLLSTNIIKLDIRDVSENESVFVYNEIFDDDTEQETNDEITNETFLDLENSSRLNQGSIYPVNYENEELDIKESHIQVISFIRKNQQGKLLIPEFQRNQVWKQQQKSRFIESLILNIPVPPFYISQDNEGNMIIVDGLQRSTAIFEFFNNQFALVGLDALPKLNNKSYNELEDEIKARIEDRELLLYILKPSVPIGIVYDIFNRINSNGTPLTRQEIRNCIFIGQSTVFLKRMSENIHFKTAINNGIPSLRMKDRETILRFFAFMFFDFNLDYQGNLDSFLGKTMRKINHLNNDEISQLENRFIRVMKLTYDCFKERNFRLPTPNSRGRINIALFESISVFFDKNSNDFIISNKKHIIDNYFNVLLKDVEFIESVRFSTNSPRNVKIRFNKVNEILSK